MSRVITSFPLRLRWLAVSVAGLAGLAAIAGDIGGSAPAVPTDAVMVTVERATVGRAVPAGFLGLSMELPTVEQYAGTDPRALNPVFEQLLRNLAPGQRPVLRLGGDSTDWTWSPVGRLPRPPWVRFTLTPGWMGVTKALTEALDARLIVGVNLESNRPKVAAAEATALISGLGRRSIEALEVGNEPELYGAFSWYRNSAGTPFTGRPRGYDFSDFTQDFSRVAGSLPQIPLAGPAVGAPNWEAQLGPFLTDERRVGLATLHAYPLKKCSATKHVTIAQLLSETSSIGLADSVAPYAAVADAHGVPLRIDEMNAVSCGGERGVSDTFASSLWSLDTLFAMARAGIAGVNFHTVPNKINELFAFQLVHGVWQGDVHPNYYGLMMFAQAAPAGARLLKLAGTTGGTLRTWATIAPDGHVRVVLINPNTARARVAAVRVPAARGSAALERLTAPTVTATSGVSLGGQSFGALTTTGQLAGAAQSESVTPSSGRYVVRLPAASAVMLTLSR